jgi:hypothetical protein
MRFVQLRAINAKRNSRINRQTASGNLVITFQTITIITRFDPPQCRGQCGKPVLPAFFGGKLH